MGNRLTYDTPEGITIYEYYPQTNRLQSFSGPASAVFHYDDNGSTNAVGPTQYVHSENNRLARVADGGNLSEYLYDGEGRRATIVTATGTRTFHYGDGVQPIAETAFGGLQSEYVFIESQPLAKVASAGTLYIHVDHLGTPLKMTDQSATIAWTLESRPFNDGAITTGTETLHFRLPGQYFDEVTGLNYNYFRHYDSSIGRYLETDPLGLESGSNLYEYANVNPLVYIDPLGLQGWQAAACCDGKGGYKICWNPNYKQPPEPFKTCVEEHENDHNGWFPKHDKNYPNHECDFGCKGKPDKFKDFPADSVEHGKQHKEELECSGYKAEIECYEREKSNYPQYDKEIKKRIKDLKDIAAGAGWRCVW